MEIPPSAAEHYKAIQRLQVATLAATRRAWSQMTPTGDLEGSWRVVGPRLALVTASAQLGAARQGSSYVGEVLADLDEDDAPEGRANPRAFSGVAADGRDLERLLYGAVVESRQNLSRYDNPAEALARGGRWLDMTVQTAVSDASRGAAGVEIAARPRRNIGFIRVLNPPSCSRCAILAGRWYGWNEGFQRHPRCDCFHSPIAEADGRDAVSSPRGYFDSLDEKAQNKAFTRDGAQAIRDGADPSQVVNARRGMSASGESRTRTNEQGLIVNERRRTLRPGETQEGITRRGIGGQAIRREGKRVRLVPEQIYRRANGDRTEAIRLLKANGYLL